MIVRASKLIFKKKSSTCLAIDSSKLVNKRTRGEYTKMNYKSQQPGGLTDANYAENNRQSFRERNWFSAPFNVASLTFIYDISTSVNLQIKSFATIAERNSVGFTKSITTKDSINPITLDYNARQVDRDNYKNYGAEARVAVKYLLKGMPTVFAGGIRAYSGNTKRNQLGIGTTGSDFDLTLTNPQYGKSLEFGTTNYAIFAENIFESDFEGSPVSSKSISTVIVFTSPLKEFSVKYFRKPCNV